jgi:NADPH:quinone reductase-like Zn-dependent oxidoreductase
MKAVYLNELGGPEVLQVGQLPDPIIAGPDSIVVDIYAASVNHVDCKSRRGASVHVSIKKFPHVLGRDFSGKVAALGESVTDFAIGDDVFGVCDVGQEGTYCEKIAIQASLCARKPPSISHVDACANAAIGLTAVISLEECLQIQPGERLFISGGAGGVAGFAIPLAKHLGATVITTTSVENTDYVKDYLGADQVIDYHKEDFRTVLGAGRTCDAAYDTVGGPEYQTGVFDILKEGGRAAFITSLTAPASPSKELYTSLRPDVVRSRRVLERVVELLLLLEESSSNKEEVVLVLPRPHVHLFTLEQAVQAHELSESRHFRGKLVFQIRPE